MPANMQRRTHTNHDGYKLNYCAYAMLHALVYTHTQQTTNNLWPTDRKQQLHLHSLPPFLVAVATPATYSALRLPFPASPSAAFPVMIDLSFA